MNECFIQFVTILQQSHFNVLHDYKIELRRPWLNEELSHEIKINQVFL